MAIYFFLFMYIYPKRYAVLPKSMATIQLCAVRSDAAGISFGFIELQSCE